MTVATPLSPEAIRVPSRDAIGGVIVTFHPDADFRSRLVAIAREVGDLIVIDNSADADVTRQLTHTCHAVGCRLVCNPGNVGLGAALNTGFTLLAQAGLAWAIAFDQDSTPAPGMAMALASAALKPGQRPAAVVGANWTDENRPGHSARHLRPSARVPLCFHRTPAHHDLGDVTCVITSGSLFSLAAWRALDGFDARLFLDLVDTDFCLRARTAGHDVRVATAAKLTHRRGTKQPVRFAGLTWWPAFLPPRRLYISFRNRMLLFSRHARHFPHWVVFELIYSLKVLADIVCVESDKSAKLNACLRGSWDGWRGRSGAPDFHA